MGWYRLGSPRDVWDIQPNVGQTDGHNTKNKNRIGYRTEKPEPLLDKIIKTFSNSKDMILDCFGGGGTTAVVAAKLGRKFITGDVSPVAVRVMCERIKSLDTPPPHFLS